MWIISHVICGTSNEVPEWVINIITWAIEVVVAVVGAANQVRDVSSKPVIASSTTCAFHSSICKWESVGWLIERLQLVFTITAKNVEGPIHDWGGSMFNCNPGGVAAMASTTYAISTSTRLNGRRTGLSVWCWLFNNKSWSYNREHVIAHQC